jgi:hypothetical protein
VSRGECFVAKAAFVSNKLQINRSASVNMSRGHSNWLSALEVLITPSGHLARCHRNGVLIGASASAPTGDQLSDCLRLRRRQVMITSSTSPGTDAAVFPRDHWMAWPSSSLVTNLWVLRQGPSPYPLIQPISTLKPALACVSVPGQVPLSKTLKPGVAVTSRKGTSSPAIHASGERRRDPLIGQLGSAMHRGDASSFAVAGSCRSDPPGGALTTLIPAGLAGALGNKRASGASLQEGVKVASELGMVLKTSVSAVCGGGVSFLFVSRQFQRFATELLPPRSPEGIAPAPMLASPLPSSLGL